MKKYLLLSALALVAQSPVGQNLAAQASAAEPAYQIIHLEIYIHRPAAEVWSKVGGYCDIAQWLNTDCKITAGSGDVGTVRSLVGGRFTEILVGRTKLSYAYTQPPKDGQFYNLYHGFMEARPVTAKTSKIVYTIMWDPGQQDAAARDAETAQRRTLFENALKKMKAIAEGG